VRLDATTEDVLMFTDVCSQSTGGSAMAREENEWVKIDDAAPDIAEESWSLYWGEAKSSSPYFEKLLRQPLAVLRDEIEGVGSDWHVTTQMINSHVPFTTSPVCRVAMVMPEEKEVLLLLYKHRAE
jgi:hypothetical protein